MTDVDPFEMSLVRQALRAGVEAARNYAAHAHVTVMFRRSVAAILKEPANGGRARKQTHDRHQRKPG